MVSGSQCRLCEHVASGASKDALGRDLYYCPRCSYVYVSKEHILKPDEEKRRYEQHRNSIDDPDYVAFLEKLLIPLSLYLKRGDVVLDYGSGPKPVLKELLARKGYSPFIYDPFFSPLLPDDTYTAITATEVFEHFQNPRKEIETIMSHLDSGGLLGIMTLRFNSETDFKTWHYMRDPTHIGFFSDKTFEWIERKYSLTREYDDGERVLILKRS